MGINEIAGHRYELKMVQEGVLYSDASSWIRSHTVLFREAFPPRRVNNLYFDTLDGDWMADHINGSSQRAKLRLRWYGDSWRFSESQLELKIKEGRLGRKKFSPIQTEIDLSVMSWYQVHRILLGESSEAFQIILSNARPVLINTYLREYYVSADSKVRVTLDRELTAYDQSFGLSPQIHTRKPLLDTVIIEFKASPENHQSLADAVAEFPLTCEQFSKFLTGME